MTAAPEPIVNSSPRTSSLLAVEDLRVAYSTPAGDVMAVNGVSFNVDDGEIVALVGESGCGKTTVGRSLIGLLPSGGRVVAGDIRFENKSVRALSRRELRSLRGAGIGVVFQDPLSAFDPLFPVGKQIAEAIRAHERIGSSAAHQRAVELLREVEIPDPGARARSYPHELSGGMRQRAMLAMAISCSPRLLIADEPTTALDVTIQAQVMELMSRLSRERGMAVLLISHDLGVVATLAQRILVMYAGFVVEEGPADRLLLDPGHPYTSALIASVVQIDAPRAARLRAIPGSPPGLIGHISSCPFAPRCVLREATCDEANPHLVPYAEAHSVACWVNAPSEQT